MNLYRRAIGLCRSSALQFTHPDLTILIYHRQACGSIWGCLHSWSYLHNESVNIYSHIIGAFLFLLLLPSWLVTTTIPPRFAIATPEDGFVCGIWLFGVGICFVLSTVFHTLMSHSHTVYHLGMKLDFQGILLLMWGATVPLIYYSFPCHTAIQTTYYLVITTLALLCSITTLVPYFSGPHVGHLRAGLFTTFGLGSFLVPILHGVAMYGFAEQKQRISLGWIGMLVTCNGIGCVAYTIKFPERWFPRRFDIWGASHQVMHVMVVLAALSYTVAIFEAFDYRHEYGPIVCAG
ncbi:hemolysin-III related domain containing protein [Rhypophila decipiens]